MHTIQTVIPTAVRPSARSTGATPARGRTASAARRAARLLSAWAERHLLDTRETRQVPATPRREYPLPWA
ncbi:hypothetical protein [Amnibacterium kyonggiense]|uniref:Uncharacterized protein n=1 Tax=Amnibacterium kyonggiense TaxID=595671 RepID=A0A4V3EAY5_9MICO|nr:hypothetical protein [Amnibacterium kyonggiense]TDS79614.1 hypothetical protein CLV52_0148 [Amnibacterium kyonggiense]